APAGGPARRHVWVLIFAMRSSGRRTLGPPPASALGAQRLCQDSPPCRTANGSGPAVPAIDCRNVMAMNDVAGWLLLGPRAGAPRPRRSFASALRTLPDDPRRGARGVPALNSRRRTSIAGGRPAPREASSSFDITRRSKWTSAGLSRPPLRTSHLPPARRPAQRLGRAPIVPSRPDSSIDRRT